MCGSTVIAATLPPRMWKITSPIGKGPITTFYILGVTHYGLPSEFDTYFYRNVIPAFRRSDTLSFEGAGGAKREERPECSSEILDEDAIRSLNSIRGEIYKLAILAGEVLRVEAARNSQTTIPSDAWSASMLGLTSNADEFELYQLGSHYRQIATTSTRKASATSRFPVLKGSVVTSLLRLNPNIRVSDVDSMFGVRRAYCNSDSRRIVFLASVLNGVRSDSLAASSLIVSGEKDIKSLLMEHKLPDDTMALTALDKNFVCERNKEWLSNLKATVDGRNHFYALGMRHLFAIHHNDANCSGFLQDLMDSGYRVKQVKQ